jgi:hypothetical protein
MADDKNKPVTNTKAQQEQPAVASKSEPSPRKLIINDDDIATKEELKKAKNDTKVDINSVLEEYQATIAKDNKSRIRNVDKTPLSIPLTKSDTLPDLAEKIITDAIVRSPADFADEMEDYSSDYSKVYGASEYYSSGNEMLKDALSKTNPKDLVQDIAGVKEGVAGVGTKHINPDNPRKVYSGEEGYRIFATLTSGVRRVTLWNSGITLTLRNIPLRQLDKYLELANHTDYEYGKEYGAWYYLFSSLVIDKHIVEQILPDAIVSSNYKDWQDTDKLLSQISLQDYQVILWALTCLMYPNGTQVSYICGNKDCGHIHNERVDLGKLRLNNMALINDEMIKHFSSKNRVDDKSLEEYRKACNLEEVITFDVSDSPDYIKRYKITLKQANLRDYLDVGKAYNAELNKQIDNTSRDAVMRYITYNQNRCYRPWIKSVECTVIIDGQVMFNPVVENDSTGNNDKTIDCILDEIQQSNIKFNKQMQDYIQKTKISHIAFFFDKCPKCGEKPVTSYEGYIPYDMSQAFFTLGRMKLLRISYQQNEQLDSNNTSTNTSAS